MKRLLRPAAAILVILLAAWLMPFITVETNAGERMFRVPFGASFEKDENNIVTFTSMRSTYALEKDAKNAMYSYGESKCYGKTYYYDEANDLSYYDIVLEGGIPSRVSYVYEKGNTCLGWSEDDEIAWPYGDPKDIDLDSVSVEEVMADEENPWFVVEDGKSLNLAVYNNHFRMFKQGVMCYFRTMVIENGERSLIDIQLLDPENGAYYIRTNNAEGIEEGHYARVSEAEIDGDVWMCAYQKQWAGEEPVPLFKVEKE